MTDLDPNFWLQVIATIVTVTIVVFAAGWRLGTKINDLKIENATKHADTREELAKVGTRMAELEGKLTERMREHADQHLRDYHKRGDPSDVIATHSPR